MPIKVILLGNVNLAMAKVQCERMISLYTLVNEKTGFNTNVRPIQPYYTKAGKYEVICLKEESWKL